MQHSKMFAFLAATGLLLSPALIPTSRVLAFDPNYIISDEEMRDSSTMDFPQIAAFLSRGYLANYRTEDVNGLYRNAAQIIYATSQTYGINPQVLLVLLQKEQSLITDKEPSRGQLDWATGYGVCDSCHVGNSTMSRFQGFAKQINSAGLQFIEGYMADIDARGVTYGKYGPGKPVTIDGTTVIPANAATAALYAYTPHIHGNKNFATLWNAWFGRDYPDGTLMQVPGDSGVWLIQDGYRRAITSQSALRSRFNTSLVVKTSKDTLERFAIGKTISLPNYTLVKDEAGQISLLVDDSLRHIDTMDTFRAIGFSEDEVVAISSSDASAYDVGEAITAKTLYPQGRLLQLKSNGAVFYIENGTRHAVLDKSVLLARFPNDALFPADAIDVEQYKEGRAVGLTDGMLVKVNDAPAVFVISDGLRRSIPTESVFTSYGYSWKNIVTVPQSVLNLHPLGEPLTSAPEDKVQTALK
ncbi:MAG: hypothetical protein WC813_01965 [Patescibacteria group bacterium]|jgi:hypothetical protein